MPGAGRGAAAAGRTRARGGGSGKVTRAGRPPAPRIPSGELRQEATILSELLVLLSLVLVSGVLAGAEIAIVALRKSRLEQLVVEKRRGAEAVRRLSGNPERFLATVQIGITVVGATAGAFGGSTLAVELEPNLARLPGVAPYAEELALGFVVALVSYMSLVLGELVPKSLALRASEPYALFVGRPLLALAWVARPLVWFLTASSNLVLRPFRDETNFTEARMSPEELRQIVSDAAEAGSVDPTSGAIAARALAFDNLTAAHVMIPRDRVQALRRDASREEVLRVVTEGGHSRMPVFERSLDEIAGYVTLRDLIPALCQGGAPDLGGLVRPAYFAPDTMRAVDLLQELRRRRVQLAIVSDELGLTRGIATIEDLVEELVGEIFREDEIESSAPSRGRDGDVVLRADTSVRDLNRTLGLNLPEGSATTTLGGLCVELAGRLPAPGTTLSAPGGTVLQVTAVERGRIRTVRVRPAAQRGGKRDPGPPRDPGET